MAKPGSFADVLIAAIVNEGQWLTMSVTLAVAAVMTLLYRGCRTDVPTRRLMLAAMSLIAGTTVGTMAFGHLLAVTTKSWMGTLEGSLPVFYLIGIGRDREASANRGRPSDPQTYHGGGVSPDQRGVG